MTGKLLLSLLIFGSFFSIAQHVPPGKNFEPGYIVDSNGTKQPALVRFFGWPMRPHLAYKLDENSPIIAGNTENLSGFGIDGKDEFVRAKVNVDRSSFNLNKISMQAEPEFCEETVFLKKIYTGNVVLYHFADNSVSRFYIKNGEQFEPLIYKIFQATSINLGYNNSYKKQLRALLTCQHVSEKDIEKAQYRKASLIALFEKNGKCLP